MASAMGERSLLSAEPLGHGVGNLVGQRLDGGLHGAPDGALAEALGGRVNGLEAAGLDRSLRRTVRTRGSPSGGGRGIRGPPGEDDLVIPRKGLGRRTACSTTWPS